MGKKTGIAFFVLALILLGLFREMLFLTINAVLYNKYYQANEHVGLLLEPVVSVFSYQTLYIAKWFITPLFAFLFWVTQKKFLFFLFQEKKPTTWLGILYLSLFLLAGLFFVAGWALGNINKGYTFSRLFMGLLQSPAACMILIPVTYLYKKTNINQ